jgi:predicted DNA-binding mobile mystery protein A
MKRKLVRQQLDTTLGKFRSLLDISTPPKGWIRAIRDALGMSGRQLANRVGVTKQRTALIEKQELAGTATLKTLRRIAESLDCVLVYGFVPRNSLEETIRNRALRVARTRLARVSQTMSLEDQALSKQENRKILSDMVDKLVDELPSNLWDES